MYVCPVFTGQRVISHHLIAHFWPKDPVNRTIHLCKCINFHRPVARPKCPFPIGKEPNLIAPSRAEIFFLVVKNQTLISEETLPRTE